MILLKKIPLGLEELAIIRDRAEKLRDGKLKCRGDALLPIMLASFIFDSLCLPCMLSSRPNYFSWKQENYLKLQNFNSYFFPIWELHFSWGVLVSSVQKCLN